MNREEARSEAIAWAKSLLKREDVLYMDLETTSLEDPRITQIAILNHKGNLVFYSMVNPEVEISEEVLEITKVNPRDLSLLPTFRQVFTAIRYYLTKKTVITYNAAFDIPALEHNFSLNYCPSVDYHHDCAMLQFAKYQGQYSKSKSDWKWHKLPQLSDGNAHNALSDTVSLFELIKVMAQLTSFDEWF